MLFLTALALSLPTWEQVATDLRAIDEAGDLERGGAFEIRAQADELVKNLNTFLKPPALRPVGIGVSVDGSTTLTDEAQVLTCAHGDGGACPPDAGALAGPWYELAAVRTGPWYDAEGSSFTIDSELKQTGRPDGYDEMQPAILAAQDDNVAPALKAALAKILDSPKELITVSPTHPSTHAPRGTAPVSSSARRRNRSTSPSCMTPARSP